VFPLALIAGSWIAISTAYLAPRIGDGAGAFFALAIWVIATSAASAFVLMRCVNAWDVKGNRGAIR
jgi:hypothetical protein